MSAPTVIIVDYGLGNLYSIARAVRHEGGVPEISADPSLIARADRIILPGVGAFGKGMRTLETSGIREALHAFARLQRPMLGVCLGMQLLFSSSSEFGHHEGLNLVEGDVVAFRRTPDSIFKVPHVGWNAADGSTGGGWDGTLLDGIAPGSFFYFVHSFVAYPRDPGCWLGQSSYGEDTFCSVVRRGNIWGTQFHPERSGAHGLRIYRNLLFKL